MSLLTVERKILEKNDAIAAQIRDRLTDHNIFSVNLVSSPGSGKTSLVEKTIEKLSGRVKMGVIEGDVQTDLDAQRIDALNVPVVQIVTNGGCHLEANLVRDAMEQLDLSCTKLLIIENVGNLVCPSSYDLGENMKIVLCSTTEGDDKPLKYPAMFRRASALVINKIDLVPYVNCNLSDLRRHALSVNPDLKIFETSCRTGEGIDTWCDWLENQIRM